MTFLAVGLLAISVVLVSLARRTAGRPPLWRSKVAFAGAVICVTLAIVLVAVDPSRLGDSLRWEPARGGELFPHIYGRLPMEAVVTVGTVERTADGAVRLPA